MSLVKWILFASFWLASFLCMVSGAAILYSPLVAVGFGLYLAALAVAVWGITPGSGVNA